MIFITLSCLLLNLFIYWCYGIYKRNEILRDIPGPPPIPFFGYPLPRDIYGLPTMFNNLTSTYGKTCKVFIGETQHVVTCDRNLIEAVLKSSTHITKSKVYDFLRPWLNDGLLMSHGNKWKQRRRMCTPSFHFSMMKDFFTTFKAATESLMVKFYQEANQGKVINVMEFASKFALDIVGESAFGIKLNTQNENNQKYIDAVNTIAQLSFVRNFSIWKRFDLLFRFSNDYVKHQKALKIVLDLSMNLIKERRAYYENIGTKNIGSDSDIQNKYNRRTILIDALLQNPEMSNEDIQEELNNFLFAGYDTVSTVVSFTLFELGKCMHIQEKLYDEFEHYLKNDYNNLTLENLNEMKYLDQVVKEILRLRTTVPLVERKLTEDAIFNGKLYPKGIVITLLFYWMHHNSEYYPDPEKFDPERFAPENQAKRHPFLFLPFSAGLRNCIGQKYGVLEVKTVLIRTIMEFKIFPVEDFKLELGMGAVLLSKHGFSVKLQRRM